MMKNEYRVIGVMSGTSLDGIDIADITFTITDGKWHYKIINCETFSYKEDWVLKLKNLISLSADALEKLDVTYTTYLASVINKFINQYQINDIDFVSSHGHTALHNPENNITYQIGNKSILAKLIGKPVVCDFRIQDVEFGGQGAPLVPIGDDLLFPEYNYCVNLGGFSNISMKINNRRVAFDICPVNIVLNKYASQLGFAYDKDGDIALSGIINEDLLQQLNQLAYYKQASPKSLGLEWVDTVVFPLIDLFQLQVKDVLRTFVAHVALQISSEINKTDQSISLITGGGVYNKFLIQELKNRTSNKIFIPENELVEFKEALVFGLLGVLRFRNETNCFASITGASHDHSSGKIYLP